MWNRNKRRGHRLTEGYILTFSWTTLRFHIQSLTFCFFLATRIHRWAPTLPLLRALTGRSPDLLTKRITYTWPIVCDYSVSWYPYIYNFITPTHSSRSMIQVICLHPLLLSGHQFVYTGVSCVEFPYWRFCQRSVCNRSWVRYWDMDYSCLF